MRVGDGLLDLGLAQGGAAGVRAVQRHALLPDLLRRPRAIEERHLHRPGSDPADSRRPELGHKEKGAKTFYLLGSDYIWPRTSNKIARKHIENVLKLKVVGEEYFPLGSTQFNSVINKMKLVKPDVIYAIIVGGSNVAFYKQLKAAGIDLTKQTLMTISVTEDEILGIGGENIVGAYACMKYFESLDNPNNKAFVPAFQKMWGDKTVIGDVTQAAYLGPWLWKLTVEKAGSFDIDKIAAASPGVEFKGAPEGYVRIHENHHLWSKTRVGRARDDGQYDVIYETAELMEPDPFPKGYQ